MEPDSYNETRRSSETGKPSVSSDLSIIKRKSGHFSIGSTKNTVLQIQGSPNKVRKYESLDEEIWSYDFSSITFKSGRVYEFSNTSGNLNINIPALKKAKSGLSSFAIGSSKDDVLQAQGNPTRIRKYDSLDEEVWSYDFSSVTFKSGRVNEYSNSSGNLNVKMTDSKRSQDKKFSFSIGATKNEVLQVQGNPTRIRKYESLDEEVWSYGFSSITFKNGRVSEYSDTNGNLKIRL